MTIIERIKGLILNRELVSYVVVGVLTTLVNFVFFTCVNEYVKGLGFGVSFASKAAYVTAFVAAVIFAYWANKLVVFKNFKMSPGYLLKEFAGFMSARIISGVITFILMAVCVDIIKMNEYLAWLLTSAFNLIFNYVASKFYIFKKN